MSDQDTSRDGHVSGIADYFDDVYNGEMSISTGADQIYDGFLRDLTIRVREVNVANGWYDDERTFGEGIALLHSEVSEMLEAFRDHGTADATPLYNEARAAVGLPPHPKPEGVGSEAADVLIRLLDECDRAGIDLQFEFDRKLAYNATRGHKHGGKRL